MGNSTAVHRAFAQPSNNAERWKWLSSPFGDTYPDENPAGAGAFRYDLRFPGQQYTAVSGLNYNYFRDYDSGLGRYTESDPIGLAAGVNTFGYAAQSPLLGIDPDGLLSERVERCVCSQMKASNFDSQVAFSTANYLRKNPGPWDDPVLRVCENYLYSYYAVRDGGINPYYMYMQVLGHHLSKQGLFRWVRELGRLPTTGPSPEARDAGKEGIHDALAGRDWKVRCELCGLR